MAKSSAVAELETIGSPTDGGRFTIKQSEPYTVRVTVEGVRPILFHAWNCDSVEAKSVAAKGSKAKKEDDVESYVYRNEAGVICIPGIYFVRSIVNAAKFKQDPRSPRKSAMDMAEAAIIDDEELCPLMGKPKDWDYLDRRRVVVQQSGVTRCRPAFHKGWSATVALTVVLPEYVTQPFLRELVIDAGRLVGVGDFRPTFGRFHITKWEKTTE